MDIAQVGASGAVVLVVAFFLKYMSQLEERMSQREERNRGVIIELKQSIDKNTKVTTETLDFMRNLNGKLERALIEKATIKTANIKNASFEHVEEHEEEKQR